MERTIATNDPIAEFVQEMMASTPYATGEQLIAEWHARQGRDLPWGEESRVRARWAQWVRDRESVARESASPVEQQVSVQGRASGTQPPGASTDFLTSTTVDRWEPAVTADGAVHASAAAPARPAVDPVPEAGPAEAPWLPEIRSWRLWNLLLGGASLFYNPAWGIVLLGTGALAFRYQDLSLLVVYACVMAWAGVGNVLTGQIGWAGFGLLQFYWAFQLFRQFRRFRADGADPDVAQEPGGDASDSWSAHRIFPWAGVMLAAAAFYIPLGTIIATAATGGLEQENLTPPPIVGFAMLLSAHASVLGFAFALASVLANHDHRTLSKFTVALSGLMTAGWVLVLLAAGKG